MRIGLLIATAATALAVNTAVTASPFYVTTGQAGGAFSIDAGETHVWTIAPQGTQTEFGGGIFVMKRGANISAGITLALYEDTGTLLASVVYPNSGFVGQDFEQINMVLAAAFPVNQSSVYEVRLTGGDGISLGGADQYFIQGDTATLTLDTSDPEDIVLIALSTPEPASALLLVAGVLGLGIASRRAPRSAANSA